MNIQRFIAPTSREALAKARRAFGDGTLILSNRGTPNGVEVVATAEDSLARIGLAAQGVDTSPREAVHDGDEPAQRPARQPAPAASSTARRGNARTTVEQDTERMAMSTLSFQEYVRERMMRRRHEIDEGDTATPIAPRAAEAAAREPAAREAAGSRMPRIETRAAAEPATPAATPAGRSAGQQIVERLNAMESLIEERIGTLAWLGQTRQQPVHANLLLKLVRAGYSPELSRRLVESLARDARPAEAVRLVMRGLSDALRTDEGMHSIVDEGGAFALVGPTGVGKTTTLCKLAARCIAQHGPNSVGVISLDNQRPGAHEQLRAAARALGVVAHPAHDRAALVELLTLLAGKKLVLIDTAGVAPHEARAKEGNPLAGISQVRELLVLSACAQGESIEAAIAAWSSQRPLAGAVVTKLDEATKLGPVLDAAIRHRLVLRGVCGGQRIPQDYAAARAEELVRLSMRSAGRSVFEPTVDDLPMAFASPADAGREFSRQSWSAQG